MFQAFHQTGNEHKQSLEKKSLTIEGKQRV